MSLMPPPRPVVPPFNPDGFKTTMDALVYLKENHCRSAAPGEAFLIVTHTIKHQVGEWPTLESKAYLGVFANERILVSVINDRLWLAAKRYISMTPKLEVRTDEFVIPYRNFEYTPLKEAFAAPSGCHFDPRERFEAVTLAVGLPAVEALVMTERKRVKDMFSWYQSARRALVLPILSA